MSVNLSDTVPSSPAARGETPRQAVHKRHLTVRRTVELCIFMLIVVLLIRSFIGEAYIVPTGSMAPSLLGYHKATICPQCGFPVIVGHLGRVSPEGVPEDPQQARRHYALASCPNCGWDHLDLDNVPECTGDRVLVHKHVFDLRPPVRWELAVFQHPLTEPIQPLPAGRRLLPMGDSYVKRIIGLPGESVQIRDGDVYINGSIARKSLNEIREMRIVVFDDSHIPKDFVPNSQPYGSFRWSWPLTNGWRALPVPLQMTGGLAFLRPYPDHWLRYYHDVRQTETGGKSVWRQDELRDSSGYNGGRDSERLVHDVMLEAEVEATGNGWLDLAITDGHDDVLIHLPVGMQTGKAELRHAPAENWASNTGGLSARMAALKQQKSFFSDAVPSPRLQDGMIAHLEFGFVDRRVFLLVNGVEAFPGGVDFPSPPANRQRRSMSRPLVLDGQGPVSIGQRGPKVRARGLKLYRDVHYTDGNGREPFPHGIRQPVTLGPGEYFVLGDNSANSYDSRCWKTGPAIRHDWLVGKPFLLHLPTQVVEWQVFGDKRAMAVPDWNRMKLLR